MDSDPQEESVWHFSSALFFLEWRKLNSHWHPLHCFDQIFTSLVLFLILVCLLFVCLFVLSVPWDVFNYILSPVLLLLFGNVQFLSSPSPSFYSEFLLQISTKSWEVGVRYMILCRRQVIFCMFFYSNTVVLYPSSNLFPESLLDLGFLLIPLNSYSSNTNFFSMTTTTIPTHQLTFTEYLPNSRHGVKHLIFIITVRPSKINVKWLISITQCPTYGLILIRLLNISRTNDKLIFFPPQHKKMELRDTLYLASNQATGNNNS